MATSSGKSTHLDHLQSEVNEVTTLLKNNVEKVVERGDKIDNLQARSEDLECSSSHFKRSAVQVRKRMWWKNCKMTCILISVIALIITVIIIVVLVETKPWDHGGSSGGKNLTKLALLHGTTAGPTTLHP